MNPSWMVTPEKVQAVVNKIVSFAHPRKIILFGSYVRGEVTENSDLDVLVVTGNAEINPRKESVRIRRELKEIDMAMDILVISESVLKELADAPGLIYREILREGEVVYEFPSKGRLTTSPSDWLLNARSNLRFAIIGLGETGILPHHICFHAQQAAEKALKAVLLYYKVDFPPVHDIQQLLRSLEKAGITFPYDVQGAEILTPYAVETRYPGYWGNIGSEDVREAIQIAELVVEWAERVILKFE
ncbi:MAG: HEPN domain-containing protein [Candidatus Latescibacterota bacterium]